MLIHIFRRYKILVVLIIGLVLLKIRRGLLTCFGNCPFLRKYILECYFSGSPKLSEKSIYQIKRKLIKYIIHFQKFMMMTQMIQYCRTFIWLMIELSSTILVWRLLTTDLKFFDDFWKFIKNLALVRKTILSSWNVLKLKKAQNYNIVRDSIRNIEQHRVSVKYLEH